MKLTVFPFYERIIIMKSVFTLSSVALFSLINATPAMSVAENLEQNSQQIQSTETRVRLAEKIELISEAPGKNEVVRQKTTTEKKNEAAANLYLLLFQSLQDQKSPGDSSTEKNQTTPPRTNNIGIGFENCINFAMERRGWNRATAEALCDRE